MECEKCGRAVELHHPVISGKLGLSSLTDDIYMDGKLSYVIVKKENKSKDD